MNSAAFRKSVSLLLRTRACSPGFRKRPGVWIRTHNTTPVDPNAEKINFNWIEPDGTKVSTDAVVGQSLLDIAIKEEIDLEGACEGSLACSTCHVILPKPIYDSLEEPEEEEDDMLDLAFGLTDTSRLGCQIKVTKEMDGMEVKLPAATRNFAVDGHKPTHH